jgi:hypothetical protein
MKQGKQKISLDQEAGEERSSPRVKLTELVFECDDYKGMQMAKK